MENSYFIYSHHHQKIEIDRFHVCTWEFLKNDALVEFGIELKSSCLLGLNNVELRINIPWLSNNITLEDFYNRLKDSSNSRFIFNESILATHSLDGGANQLGIIHQFNNQTELCILPVNLAPNNQKKTVIINLNLANYQNYNPLQAGEKPNVYVRFCLRLDKRSIAIIKKGIAKSTILYDIKINQRRNIPEHLLQEITNGKLCKINTCFCFNIVPNIYDLVFLDNSTLKNLRTLEYPSFQNYLGSKLLPDQNLIVVFNKDKNLDAYSFFSIFAKEHIGTEQLTIALLVNLVAGILLFMASLEVTLKLGKTTLSLQILPETFWFAIIFIALLILFYTYKRINIRLNRKRK